MPPRSSSKRVNINSITHYGIMGGLAPQRADQNTNKKNIKKE